MINIKDITFSYGKRDILKDISFDIEENKCIEILGNNGAGKSTLIKCLNRIIPVKQGAVMVDGQMYLPCQGMMLREISRTLPRKPKRAA